MAEDWSIDVKKYVPDADDAIIAGIVRYCGIALRNRDSSLVSFTDSTETDRVRENYLKKKLGLTDPDSVLDAAIAKVGEIMKADRTKNRVTVYYLLAQHFGLLEMFRPKGKGKANGDDAVLPLVSTTPEPVVAAPPPPAPSPPAPPPPAPPPSAPPQPVMAARAPVAPVAPAAPVARRRQPGLLWPGLFALAAFGGIAALIGFGSSRPGTVVPAAPAAPVVAPVVAVPEGAGITTQEVDGRPQVSIYFDTAKSDIYPNFDARTEALRQWLKDHPGNHLVVSGYNDPRGNAEFNAKLSKSRAFAVRDALVALGVAATDIDLVKPADTTDTTDSLAQARRVDISIADGPVPPGEAATEPTPPKP
jgi:outer membrane protein OmpA-like peptidoglycan-associated protein